MRKNIREKKKIEGLRIADDTYQELVKHSSDGVFIFQDGRFKLKNSRFEVLFGSTRTEAHSLGSERVRLVDHIKEYQRRVGEKREQDNTVSSFRFVMSCEDTSRRDSEVVMTSIEYQGRSAVHGIVRDSTRRGMGEVQPSLITVAAHEIRSAITVIDGSNRILLRKQLGPLTPAQDEVLKNCIRGCDRLKSIVEQIFDHSRIAGSEIKMHFRKGNIGDCIIKVYEECRTLAQNKNIVLSRRISKHAVLTVPLDHEKIEQALINLTNNAIENTPEDGRVELQVKHFTENFTKVCVVDTGPGVPAEERELIFEAFKRGKNFKSAGGLGLGLAICRKIIELHKGDIWVEPRKGGGSKFIFTLPIKRS